MTEETELAKAERDVRAGEEALARLRRQLDDGSPTPEKRRKLAKAEDDQALLIEKRNALFRDVAGNDY